jgi:hypothetical protein
MESAEASSYSFGNEAALWVLIPASRNVLQRRQTRALGLPAMVDFVSFPIHSRRRATPAETARQRWLFSILRKRDSMEVTCPPF